MIIIWVELETKKIYNLQSHQVMFVPKQEKKEHLIILTVCYMKKMAIFTQNNSELLYIFICYIKTIN